MNIHKSDEFESDIEDFRGARRQLFMVAAVLFLLMIFVLAVVALLGWRSERSRNKSLIEYDGKMYEYVEDSVDIIKSAGLTPPITESACGDYIGPLEKTETFRGYDAYYLSTLRTTGMFFVNDNGQYKLYRFCYFTDANSHTGQDVLDVCGSETFLLSMDCYGVYHGQSGDASLNEEWEKTITDNSQLVRFEQLFGSLTPLEDTSDIQDQLDNSNSWDVVITLKYADGLTFNVCLYDQLKVMTGFRCVYNVSDEMMDYFNIIKQD